MGVLIEELEHASSVIGKINNTTIKIVENHGTNGWATDYDLTVGKKTYRHETLNGISAILEGKQIFTGSIEWQSAFDDPADDPFRDCQHRR